MQHWAAVGHGKTPEEGGGAVYCGKKKKSPLVPSPSSLLLCLHPRHPPLLQIWISKGGKSGGHHPLPSVKTDTLTGTAPPHPAYPPSSSCIAFSSDFSSSNTTSRRSNTGRLQLLLFCQLLWLLPCAVRVFGGFWSMLMF